MLFLILLRSVCKNNISGDGAETLAKVVLKHSTLTGFCGIPLVSLRENRVTELDLKSNQLNPEAGKCLSVVLANNSTLRQLKYAPHVPCD